MCLFALHISIHSYLCVCLLFTPVFTVIYVFVCSSHQYSQLFMCLFALRTSIHSYLCVCLLFTPVFTVIYVFVCSSHQYSQLFMCLFALCTNIHSYLCVCLLFASSNVAEAVIFLFLGISLYTSLRADPVLIVITIVLSIIFRPIGEFQLLLNLYMHVSS